MDDEEQIRELIEGWAAAVHRGDMAGVLADHAEDIVMYDVPAPYDGVHGIDAYRQAWPGFFQWQASGALFEIDALTISAGTDVAFAFALLRCGEPEELAENPQNRLRLTLGLVKRDGRWVIQHEHHSFPLTGVAEQLAAEEVRQVQEHWTEHTAAKDLEGLMAPIADDIVSYEHERPLAHVGVEAVREVCRRGLEFSSGQVTFTNPDQQVVTAGDLAVTWGLDRVEHEEPAGQRVETWSRGTRVLRRRSGRWQVIHQHLSYPFDPQSGQACTDLRPE